MPLEVAVADERAARLAARPAASEVARAKCLAEEIAAAHPSVTSRAERVPRAVADQLASGPATVARGALKPAHVLLDGDRVTLLDLDRLSVADPLGNVENLVYLLARRLGHRPDAGRPLPGPARALVAAY